MRSFVVLFAALALVAAACGDDSQDAAPASATTASSTTASTTIEPPTSSTTEALDGSPDRPEANLTDSCTSPDRFSIDYPGLWGAVADCGQFGPEPIGEPAPNTDERAGVVSAYVDAVPFHAAAEPRAGERSRAVTTVRGRQAVRTVTIQEEDRLYPAGTESVAWMVDLSVDGDAGHEAEPGTLFLTAVDVRDDGDFDTAVAVLDAMARSLVIEFAGPPDDGDVVARNEGGATPFVVAASGSASDPASCFRLVEADAVPTCVAAVGDGRPVSLTGLDGVAAVTVGITGSDVFAVEVTTRSSSMTFLPVTYPGRDSLAFALPVAVDDVTLVTLLAADGTVLAEVDSPAAEGGV